MVDRIKLSDVSDTRWENIFINESAIKYIAEQFIYKASTIQGNNKIAWLLKAITFIDLTTLSGDDTKTNVEELCKKAANPIKLNFEWTEPLRTAAICVYPTKAPIAIDALKELKAHISNSPDDYVRVACVAAGFPTGQYPLVSRLREIEYAAALGVDEIDVVIDRSLVWSRRWDQLFHELRSMREACGKSRMKTILSVGELPSLKDVYVTSMISMHAGSDFIKTSTGKEALNATLPFGIVMCRAIRDFYKQTSRKVGFKPAGGIKNSMDALQWLILVKEELGSSWLSNDLFRIGASGLLDDIVKSIQRL